ncbi:hypothetical protein Q3G72_032697 [Acer saccharum]|nr:hypothetical protein Q3G72_032697 [Acer saccharum]
MARDHTSALNSPRVPRYFSGSRSLGDVTSRLTSKVEGHILKVLASSWWKRGYLNLFIKGRMIDLDIFPKHYNGKTLLCEVDLPPVHRWHKVTSTDLSYNRSVEKGKGVAVEPSRPVVKRECSLEVTPWERILWKSLRGELLAWKEAKLCWKGSSLLSLLPWLSLSGRQLLRTRSSMSSKRSLKTRTMLLPVL